MSKDLSTISEPLLLSVIQLYVFIKRKCPKVIAILFLSKNITTMDSRMHKIPMHGRKERIDDLLKVVVQSSLPLPSIGPHPILDQIQQQVDTI